MNKFLNLAATALVSVAAIQSAGSAQASTFTRTSPALGGTTVPSGVTPVGGIVLDLIGLNNARVTSQLAASQLFVGFYDGGNPPAFNGNPGTIGIQTGFTSAITSALGGGIKEAAIRFTLFDGDTAAGDFDFGDNTLLVNGINFGNWSDVNTEETDGLGNGTGAPLTGGGFRDNTLNTGWFFVDDAATLNSLFASLVSTGEVVYQVDDVDPFDNFYDFTQGIDGGLVNVGQPPIITQPTPEPSSILAMFALGGLSTAALKRKQQQKATAKA